MTFPDKTSVFRRLHDEGYITEEEYIAACALVREGFNPKQITKEQIKVKIETLDILKDTSKTKKRISPFWFTIFALFAVLIICCVYYIQKVFSGADGYTIYTFCRFPLFFILVYGIVIFSFISSCCYLSNLKNPRCEDALFLDLICNKNILTTVIISLLCIFILLFSSKNFLILSGCDDIRIMPDGTYCYYVLATNEKDKTYTLPANIEKIDGDYYVRNVYFDNGGYLFFENEIYFSFEEYIDCADQNNNKWEIRLTSNKTTHSMVKETIPLNIGWLLLLFASILSMLISSVFYIISIFYENKQYEDNILKDISKKNKRVPNSIPMSDEDMEFIGSWGDFLTGLQTSYAQISTYLSKYTIKHIENAYRNNMITTEQYNSSKKDIENVESLNTVLENSFDVILKNQNMLIDKYFIPK